MLLVLEARHGVVRLLLQKGAQDASARLRLEHRQAPAMQEIVDERGDEHRLAGPRQAGDAQPDVGAEEVRRPVGEIVEDESGLVGERWHEEVRGPRLPGWPPDIGAVACDRKKPPQESASGSTSRARRP